MNSNTAVLQLLENNTFNSVVLLTLEDCCTLTAILKDTKWIATSHSREHVSTPKDTTFNPSAVCLLPLPPTYHMPATP